MPTKIKPDTANRGSLPLKRRTFLGLGLTGVAGLSLPGLARLNAQTAAGKPTSKAAEAVQAVSETTYWDRTDRFEEKLKLLEAAWQKKDFRLARALAHSLRSTAIQAQAEEESPGTPLMAAARFETVDSLPSPWRTWAKGWKYFKTLTLAPWDMTSQPTPSNNNDATRNPPQDNRTNYPTGRDETIGQERPAEPIEVLLSFPAEQVTSLSREVRVARVNEGALKEVPCQVIGEVRRGNERLCKLLFMADAPARQPQTFLVLYGNPDAELPAYPSDLVTTGEGFGLDIENQFYKASLSRQMGQLERLTLKREHGLELFSGGEGHGEPPGIDWAHDYVPLGSFQKLRITYWDACPDYEVVRGPLCTIVRRWGFPYSPVHPLFSPSRLNIDVEYRFYAGLPWFHKTGRMTAVKDFEAGAMRDDEWVFSGFSFTDRVWMGADGKLRTGEVDKEHLDNVWGLGFFNKDSKDSFIGLFLEHKADGLPELKHSGAPTLSYRWHGQLWSRYPLPGTHVPAGAVLHEKNAYVALPFTEADGPRMIEELRRRLVNPLVAAAGDLPKQITAKESPGRLARPGEAGDSPIPKQSLWDALRDCKDAQFYTADINVVDLGLVYDVRVRGDVVTVVMAMPHRGRPRLGYFTHGSISVHPTLSLPVRERLMKVPGVRQVVVEQTWEPGWSSNQLTNEGRRKFGL